MSGCSFACVAQPDENESRNLSQQTGRKPTLVVTESDFGGGGGGVGGGGGTVVVLADTARLEAEAASSSSSSGLGTGGARDGGSADCNGMAVPRISVSTCSVSNDVDPSCL